MKFLQSQEAKPISDDSLEEFNKINGYILHAYCNGVSPYRLTDVRYVMNVNGVPKAFIFAIMVIEITRYITFHKNTKIFMTICSKMKSYDEWIDDDITRKDECTEINYYSSEITASTKNAYFSVYSNLGDQIKFTHQEFSPYDSEAHDVVVWLEAYVEDRCKCMFTESLNRTKSPFKEYENKFNEKIREYIDSVKTYIN